MSSHSSDHHWLPNGAALVVDDQPLVARSCAAMLEAAGCACHVAVSYREALSVVAECPDIGLVIADHGVDGDDMEEFVTGLRASRPGVILVGSSGSDCRAELKRIGVDRFLMKPWSLGELRELVTGRFEKCAMCSIELPLRKPFAGEVGQSWVCAYCGCSYRAVLDHDALADAFQNVRRLD